MRLDCVSVGQVKSNSTWRLKKTTARKLSFRPIENEDLRYIWAAYKDGALASMGETFASADLAADEFKTAFEQEVVNTYHAAWTLFAESKRGVLPIGLVLGFWSHHDAERAPFMILGDMIWFPWASLRNKIESAVNFFNEARREIPMVEYARMKDKRFFEMIARHGIMRRVGTSHNVYRGEPAAVFETRNA